MAGSSTSPQRIALAIGAVYLVINVVPLVVYGGFSAAIGLEPPTPDEPGTFMIRVFAEKLGHAIAFVGLFALAPDRIAPRWLAYAGLWFVMFAIGEVTMAMGPDYTAAMAVGGIGAEAVYLPLAAWVTRRMLA